MEKLCQLCRVMAIQAIYHNMPVINCRRSRGYKLEIEQEVVLATYNMASWEHGERSVNTRWEWRLRRTASWPSLLAKNNLEKCIVTNMIWDFWANTTHIVYICKNYIQLGKTVRKDAVSINSCYENSVFAVTQVIRQVCFHLSICTWTLLHKSKTTSSKCEIVWRMT